MSTTANPTHGSPLAGASVFTLCCGAIDELPVAGCLLSANSDHIVLSANKQFYQLIGCPPEEFQYRFGGRFSAAAAGDWPVFSADSGGEAAELECQLRVDSRVNRWLHISARCHVGETEPFLFCVLSDCSVQKRLQLDYADYKSVFEHSCSLADSETFVYSIATQRATIYHRGTILEQISPKDLDTATSFQQIFSLKGLLDNGDELAFQKAFASICRKEAAVCEVRLRTNDGKWHWMRLSLAMKNPGEESCEFAVGILQNITELKAANLHCLGEAQFLQAILSEKEAYVQVDITTDRLLRVGGKWFLYSGLLHSTAYSTLVSQHLRRTIHPQDSAYYLEFMSSENLLQSLDNGIDQLSCRVRRAFGEGESSWIEIKAFLFRNPFSQTVEALICSGQLEKNSLPTVLPAKNNLHHAHSPATAAIPSPADRDFEHLLSESGDIAYLVDMESFELLAGNEALYRRIGVTRDECAGKTCYWIMHHRTSPCPFCGRANWSKDRFYIWKNWNPVLQQDFLIKNRIVSWQGREVLLAIAVEVAHNKSFFDFIDDGGSESHSVLAGIQGMSAASSLDATIQSSLKTIGEFFGAGAVQYWAYRQKEESFSCGHEWNREAVQLDDPNDLRVLRAVNQWVHKLRWTYPVNIENQEAMLCHSFEMYNLMKEFGIWNQRWIPLRDGDALLGILVVTNLLSHFQNNSFLDTFSVFMLEEWRNKARVDELVYASLHDELTGLFNRKSYEQSVQLFSSDGVDSLGIVSANINDLEEINNHQGLQGGDDCVRHFASKLQSAFQEGQLYRLGGGEFLAVLPDFSREKLSARLEELEDEVVSCHRYSIAVGYAWDDIEKELPDLIHQASQAMRLNKQRQFDTVKTSSDAERQLMVERLMRALENNEFEVFLQPKVNLFSGQLIGAEALIRYRDGEDRIIPPSRFIDILERNNLIRFVDFFVFEKCCQMLERWTELNLPLPVISFNFSRLTLLERNIVASVQAIFGKYSIPKDRVEIEITESVADLSKGVLYQAAHELYQAGFSIALDDFGTKYTNLDILSEIEFDMLKVDKSLVSSLTKRRSNQIILQNIITMCRHLNISVIAEGVETKTQESVLRSLGCRYGQGYLYGRPMPLPDFEEKFMAYRPTL